MSRLFKSIQRMFPNPSPSNTHRNAKASGSESEPPEWAPAPGQTVSRSHSLTASGTFIRSPNCKRYYGKFEDAPGKEYDAAEEFCDEVPLNPPRLLPSDTVDRINQMGCKAWGIEVPVLPRFVGHVQNDSKAGHDLVTVQTSPLCKGVCLFSDLPIIAGLYDTLGKTGIYYEVCINRMDGVIAIGTTCKPYPEWRFPGWNRMSAGFHLDDFCKFFEDAGGGLDYVDLGRINPGDTVGCGYELQTGTLFYTYNGIRLPSAFTGIYLPRDNQDVFAAIGVEGHCEFQVNFGGQFFRWNEGNEWAWRVEGHVGRLGGFGNSDEELPSYQQVRYSYGL